MSGIFAFIKGLAGWKLKLAIGAAVFMAVGSAITFLRWDAVRDERRSQELRGTKVILEQIEEDRERDNEIRNLDDDALLERLQRWSTGPR